MIFLAILQSCNKKGTLPLPLASFKKVFFQGKKYKIFLSMSFVHQITEWVKYYYCQNYYLFTLVENCL